MPRSNKVTQARRRVKYAVVEAARLRRELTDWGDLYLSGRLHKPVVTLVPDVCPAPCLSLPHPQPSHAHRSPWRLWLTAREARKGGEICIGGTGRRISRVRPNVPLVGRGQLALNARYGSRSAQMCV